MAPNATKLKMMRVVCREDFSRARCDSLIIDIKQAVESLMSMDKDKIESHLKHTKKHKANAAKGHEKHSKSHQKYHNETHSLQGKTGKTHAIC